MKFSEINTVVDYFTYSWETDTFTKRRNLMSVNLADYAHNLKLVEQFLYECMLYGNDYDDERREWLEKNRKFIDEHQKSFGFFSDDVFKCFEQVVTVADQAVAHFEP